MSGSAFTKHAELADLTASGWGVLDALAVLSWRPESAVRYFDRHGQRDTSRAIRDAVRQGTAVNHARVDVRAWLAEMGA